MDRIKDKLVALLDDIQESGTSFKMIECHGRNYPDTISNEDVAAHLIENGVTVPRWIPVEERLPTEDDADERGCVSVIHINGSKNIWHWSSADSILVTHWMPLLKGPEKEGTKLPDGKTCADCAKVRWCYSVGGVNHKNTSCNWEPIRFTPKEVQE